MALSHRLERLSLAAKNLMSAPLDSLRRVAGLAEERRGAEFARHWSAPASIKSASPNRADENPLRAHFDGIAQGPGVWKWVHYFEPYHRHLQKFIGQPVTLVEIGVYSGGSLEMWKQYFGPGCRIHGVDIEQDCLTYNDATTTIHIGDQADRKFWSQFKQQVPAVDVLIDDGGHTPEQQMVTLEAMLPHLRPGGVYICEDVHGVSNEFSAFAHSLADELNMLDRVPHDQGVAAKITPFQSSIHSIHFYPYMVVIERGESVRELVAPKHGTQWQPFILSDADPKFRTQPSASVM